MPVVVSDRECEFIETNATVSGFLTTQKNKLLIPGIEETVHFDIEYLPSQLSCVTASAG